MADIKRRSSDFGDSSSWVERYIRPLLTIFAFLAVILGALQVWIASKFVTKDEMISLQKQLTHSHGDHMDDYRKIEDGVERLNQIIRKRLPPKHGEEDTE